MLSKNYDILRLQYKLDSALCWTKYVITSVFLNAFKRIFGISVLQFLVTYLPTCVLVPIYLANDDR